MNHPDYPKGTKILCREGRQIGITTGAFASCRLEGCRGLRVYTRWKDGHITKPCSRGIEWNATRKMWQIG